MKKKLMILLSIGAILLFFSYNIVYTYDSFHYLNYVDILFHRLPIASWDIVRGPSFPFFIFAFNILFGENTMSHLIMTFTLFVILNVIIYKIIKIFYPKAEVKPIILTILLTFNPLIFGYYHVMLTEFVGITFSIISIYLAYKWINIKDKKKKFLYALYLCVITTFLWFIKQPYAALSLIPFTTSAIISLIEEHTKKEILYRTGTIIICLCFLFGSINIWNTYLTSHNVNMNTSRDSNSLLATTLSELPSYVLINSSNINEMEYELSSEEKNDITNNKYAILFTIDDNRILDKDIIKKSNNQISSLEMVLITLGNIFQNPVQLIADYSKNFCALSSVCVISSEDTVHYKVSNRIDFINMYENKTIAYRIYDNSAKTNTFPVPEYYQQNVEKYQVHHNMGWINKAMKLALIPTSIIYKITILISPILFIISLIIVCKSKNNNKKRNQGRLILILTTVSFLYLLANTYIGSFIDRYSVETIIPLWISLIGIILLMKIGRKKWTTNE